MNLDGIIAIEFGRPRDGVPLVFAEIRLRDAQTGEHILTGTRMTITVEPDEVVTAQVEELCTADGEPAHGAPVHDTAVHTREYRAWLDGDRSEPFNGEMYATRTFHYAVQSITAAP